MGKFWSTELPANSEIATVRQKLLESTKIPKPVTRIVIGRFLGLPEFRVPANGRCGLGF